MLGLLLVIMVMTNLVAESRVLLNRQTLSLRLYNVQPDNVTQPSLSGGLTVEQKLAIMSRFPPGAE